MRTLSWRMVVVLGFILALVLLAATFAAGEDASWIGPLPSVPVVVIFVVFMIAVLVLAYGSRSAAT